jgi:hypothetical protein
MYSFNCNSQIKYFQTHVYRHLFLFWYVELCPKSVSTVQSHSVYISYGFVTGYSFMKFILSILKAWLLAINHIFTRINIFNSFTKCQTLANLHAGACVRILTHMGLSFDTTVRNNITTVVYITYSLLKKWFNYCMCFKHNLTKILWEFRNIVFSGYASFLSIWGTTHFIAACTSWQPILHE